MEPTRVLLRSEPGLSDWNLTPFSPFPPSHLPSMTLNFLIVSICVYMCLYACILRHMWGILREQKRVSDSLVMELHVVGCKLPSAGSGN